MPITLPAFQSEERRDQSRRTADRAVDDLQKTYSTPHCHSCLEQMANGVLLLNNETKVIYTTKEVDLVMKRHKLPFALSPKFTLHQSHHASRFADFVNGRNREAGPLSLLLEGENGHDLLLLNCFQLPKPAVLDLKAARYMITLRDPNYYPSRQWLLFTKQFNFEKTI